MYLFDLGERSWEQLMFIFHTLARLRIEAIIIVSPQTPFIIIGYFEDVKQEVSLEYCTKKGLTIIRRKVEGGIVYLDQNQIFYHVIWKIRTAQQVEIKQLQDVGISGDFTFYLKKELIGMENTPINKTTKIKEIEDKIAESYENTEIQTPSVKPKNITKVIMETQSK